MHGYTVAFWVSAALLAAGAAISAALLATGARRHQPDSATTAEPVLTH